MGNCPIPVAEHTGLRLLESILFLDSFSHFRALCEASGAAGNDGGEAARGASQSGLGAASGLAAAATTTSASAST